MPHEYMVIRLYWIKWRPSWNSSNHKTDTRFEISVPKNPITHMSHYYTEYIIVMPPLSAILDFFLLVSLTLQIWNIMSLLL